MVVMNAALLTLLLLPGQIRYDQAAVVAEDDEIFPVLARDQAVLEEKYRKGGVTILVFQKWVHVKSPKVSRLFPQLQFASVSWSEKATPAGKHVWGRALGLERTLGIDRKD